MSAQPVMKPLNFGVHWYSTGQSLILGSFSIRIFLACFFVFGRTGSRLGSSSATSSSFAEDSEHLSSELVDTYMNRQFRLAGTQIISLFGRNTKYLHSED
uniref:Uncharacterized protein n=1 Tax=Leersia perrieri TaxID=77586 RepID=A0A0D9V976_9ORYZ